MSDLVMMSAQFGCIESEMVWGFTIFINSNSVLFKTRAAIKIL